MCVPEKVISAGMLLTSTGRSQMHPASTQGIFCTISDRGEMLG